MTQMNRRKKSFDYICMEGESIDIASKDRDRGKYPILK